MRTSLILVIVICACRLTPSVRAQSACGASGIALQVLGSGGPDVRDRRASSSYVVWQNGKSVALIDTGGGSALRFGESGARMADLKVLLFTHLHADHTSDLPALVLSSRFEERTTLLPVFGPSGGAFYPSTTEFVEALFGKARGAWRYMFPVIDGGDPYLLQAHDVVAEDAPVTVFESDDLRADAVATDHTPATPALAWRITIDGKRIVFSGDSGGRRPGLVRLAQDADLFVAPNATASASEPELQQILMPPAVIGQIAGDAHVKHLALSHRMEDTLGAAHEAQTREDIRKRYAGPLEFVNDLNCFSLR